MGWLDNTVEVAMAAGELSLSRALAVLADDRANLALRDNAARRLLTELQRLALQYRRRLRLRGPSRRAPESMLDDAIQHVALVASTGSSRFRGAHCAEAVAWCVRILENQLVTETRWHVRHGLSLDRSSPEPTRAPTVSPPELMVEARDALQRLHEEVRLHLERTRRPADVPGLYRAVCCYLDHLAGVSLSAQIERFGACDTRLEPAALRRARNRVYQLRRRGRQVLAELQRRAWSS
jgi:hypothetical protein